MRRFLRRLFALVISAALLAGSLLGYMRFIEPRLIEVTRITVRAEGVCGTVTVAAFGDTHIGMAKDERDMAKLAERINGEKADIVVFLGDLFDDYGSYDRDPHEAVAALAAIEAEHKYAVRGNHDVGGGAQWVYPDLVEEMGFKLLENDNVYLDCGINIIGAADSLYFTSDAHARVTEGFDLLLAHEPDLADEVAGAELQLSGHSHGGQIYIPFLKDRIMPSGARKYSRGMYEKPDGGAVYVNRGIGMSLLPLRLFSRPEITIITIVGE